MILYRAFATVGGLTLISRVLGFARDILIAAALGTGGVADAFFVAFRFPNLFRRLFGEGAFNAAFVPMYARKLEGDGPDEARRFAVTAMGGLAFVLVVLSAIAILAMPWLMVVLAPGFSSDPAKYDLSVSLTQIAFPYLFCMSLVALMSGVLNSHHRYWAAAAAPILLNIVLIGAILAAIYLGYAGEPGAGYVLAIGVAIAGIAQLAMLWFAVARGRHFASNRPAALERRHASAREARHSGADRGRDHTDQHRRWHGDRLAAGRRRVVPLLCRPSSISFRSASSGSRSALCCCPNSHASSGAGEREAVIDTQNRSLEFALALTLPAAVGLAVAAEPIISVLFERGAFTAADTPATAMALLAFSLGLPAFVMIKVFQPAFFAREDTATPMRFAAVNLVVNVIGSLTLFYAFKSAGLMPHVGIALATSFAAWINALMLWRSLAKSGEFRIDRRLLRNWIVIAGASLIMAAALVLAMPLLEPWLATSAPIWERALALGALVGGGLAVYLAIVFAGGVISLRQLRRA
jgi:putative peptidoglycan lipid II flippase